MKTNQRPDDKVVPPLESSNNKVSTLLPAINHDGDGEWVSSKKVINHKTRQVETRIKRQIIMEDGKIIADSGPQITTRTKEDNWTEESENCAKKGCPVDVKPIGPVEVKPTSASVQDQVVSNKVETKNTTREAKHERFQYHDESISELTGYDIHRKALLSPNDFITINCDLVNLNQNITEDSFDISDEIDGPPKGKLIHYSSKSHKVTDKEEVKETSKLGAGGEITTETVRTHHHEEVDDDEEPDNDDNSDTSRNRKGLVVEPLPEVSKETSKTIDYSKNYESPINQSNSHRGHADIKPIYDIGGRADHTNKWLESHFGSSDASQHDKETGSSSGSAVDRRGRPRQRIDPAMSQSYDEAYYSRSNTYAANTNRSQSNSSKPSIDKLDCLTGSPSPTEPIGSALLSKKLLARDSANSTSTGTSSEDSFYNTGDYHHSSEGSLSPSGFSHGNQLHSKHHHPNYHQCQCKNQMMTASSNDCLSSKQPFPYQKHNSKSISNGSSQHYIKRNHHHLNHHNVNNNRNLIIRVKHRVPKEDASVQASLSDEESDYGNYEAPIKNGLKSINSGNNNATDNKKMMVRPRPIRTYYFGENGKPIVDTDCSNDQVDENNNHSLYDHSQKVPVNQMPTSLTDNRLKLIKNNLKNYNNNNNQGHLPFIGNEKLAQSADFHAKQRIINGSLDRLLDRSLRTDLFQTRDHGSLSNWRSTINLTKSNGLTTIDGPLSRNGPYLSKDDSYKPTHPLGSLNRRHYDSVNCLNERFKSDQINGQIKSSSPGFNILHRGLSPIQERRSLFDLAKVDLLLNTKSKGSATRWPVLHSLRSPEIKNPAYLLNDRQNYHPRV